MTVATGSSRPANLGVPDTTGGTRMRWGTAGIEVLYVGADDKRLLLRRVDAGETLEIWSSPDTLVGYPIAWSASGRRAAIWSSRPSGTAGAPMRRWELHLIDLMTRTVRTIAHADVSVGSASSALAARFRAAATIFPPPSLAGLAFSPDETALAYSFFDGRIYRSKVAEAFARGLSP